MKHGGASRWNLSFLTRVGLDAEQIVIHVGLVWFLVICFFFCFFFDKTISKLKLSKTEAVHFHHHPVVLWLRRDRHRALRPRIHQPLLLDSEERHLPPARPTTQGGQRRRLRQSGHVLCVRLPGHAEDRPGESSRHCPSATQIKPSTCWQCQPLFMQVTFLCFI